MFGTLQVQSKYWSLYYKCNVSNGGSNYCLLYTLNIDQYVMLMWGIDDWYWNWNIDQFISHRWGPDDGLNILSKYWSV